MSADEGWMIRERVPVYSAHSIVRVDPETKSVSREAVTRERLQEIADKRNAKIRETGNDSLLIVGHTQSGLSEWEQAKRCPTVGYADTFEVDAHPKTGIPTLYARHKYYPQSKVGDETLSAQEVIRRFPRRSAEIWLAENDLDAVSLLGPTTPALDLDLLRMARDANPGVTLEAPMEPKTGGVQELAMALMQVLEPYLSGGQPEAAPAAPEAPAATPAQYSRQTVKVAEPDGMTPREKLLADRLQVVEAQLAERGVREKYSRIVSDLREIEGIDADQDEEVDRLMALPTDDLRDVHVGVMKTRYSRVGIGGGLIRTAQPQRPLGVFDKADNYDQITAYMLSHPGMQWDDAKAAVKAG